MGARCVSSGAKPGARTRADRERYPNTGSTCRITRARPTHRACRVCRSSWVDDTSRSTRRGESLGCRSSGNTASAINGGVRRNHVHSRLQRSVPAEGRVPREVLGRSSGGLLRPRGQNAATRRVSLRRGDLQVQAHRILRRCHAHHLAANGNDLGVRSPSLGGRLPRAGIAGRTLFNRWASLRLPRVRQRDTVSVLEREVSLLDPRTVDAAVARLPEPIPPVEGTSSARRGRAWTSAHGRHQPAQRRHRRRTLGRVRANDRPQRPRRRN